jgi:hypothetical protein
MLFLRKRFHRGGRGVRGEEQKEKNDFSWRLLDRLYNVSGRKGMEGYADLVTSADVSPHPVPSPAVFQREKVRVRAPVWPIFPCPADRFQV